MWPRNYKKKECNGFLPKCSHHRPLQSTHYVSAMCWAAAKYSLGEWKYGARACCSARTLSRSSGRSMNVFAQACENIRVTSFAKKDNVAVDSHCPMSPLASLYPNEYERKGNESWDIVRVSIHTFRLSHMGDGQYQPGHCAMKINRTMSHQAKLITWYSQCYKQSFAHVHGFLRHWH